MREVEATLSMSILGNLIDALQLPEHILKSVLIEHGLNDLVIRDYNSRVPLRTYISIFEYVSKKLNKPHIGLNIAKLSGPNWYGGVGYLFMSARTLESALENLAKYVGLVQKGTVSRVRYEGDKLYFEYQISDETIWPRRQDAEFSMSSLASLTRRYSGNKCNPVEFYFEHEINGNHLTYEEVLGAPSFFGQGVNAVVFNRKDVSQKFQTHDGQLFGVLRGLIEQSLPDTPPSKSFIYRTRAVLTEKHISENIKASQAADKVGVSKITLYRQLFKEGSSFQKLLDERRLELAKRWLSEKSIPISEVSMRLGYAGPEVFSRAFKRLSGFAPKDWRKTL